MSKNKNPFVDLFNAWSSDAWGGNNSFENFDLDKVVEAGRLNAKAFSGAAEAASQGAQAVLRRQTEILQTMAEETSKYFKDITSSADIKNPEANIAKQAEFAKASIESAIANSKELLEMAAKSSGEANEIINKRISAALAEISSNTANANKKKKAA